MYIEIRHYVSRDVHICSRLEAVDNTSAVEHAE